MKFYTYDLETYPNYFSFAGKFRSIPVVEYFEISDRINQRAELIQFLGHLQALPGGLHMVGYNSLGFDYPIIHELLTNPYSFTPMVAYNLAQEIISVGEYGRERIFQKDRIIPQIDLAKIHHFDNPARRTSLKALQFAMRSQSVDDLPIAPGTRLTPEQMDQFKIYNIHDVTETERFLERSLKKIELRQELLENGVLRGDVMNYSDVKIGGEILVSRIGRQKCYISQGKPRQTHREFVSFGSIILPTVDFATEPFHDVLEHFRSQVFYVKAKERPTYVRRLGGLDFHFGIGGVHASVESKVFRGDANYTIRDVDVAGMYPSIAVVNGFYPEHLGQEFVRAYAQIIKDRSQYPKGSSMNTSFKLAGNGVFGLSDAFFSCFYDPRFPKQITVNGQLQLCQLIESLLTIPGLTLIQANTDGTTVRFPRKYQYLFDLFCDQWEKLTKLKLEHVEYAAMWIRDVNNYMALSTTGKVKRKGAYWFPETEDDYDDVWNKDFSALVIKKVASDVMLKGWHPEAALAIKDDPFDFMLRYRATGESKLEINGKPVQKTLRYYVAKQGGTLIKRAPPTGVGFKRKPGITDKLYAEVIREVGVGVWDGRIHTKNKSTYTETVTEIEKGYLVAECNDASRFDWSNVDFNYYLKEAEKLIIREET